MTQQKRPNFIFFFADQLRADSVGTFGESIVQTPNFDRLASMGAAFNNCFVQHTVCSPSRCSIMTGWYTHVRGHRTQNFLLQKDEPNLMKYLREAGYWVEWQGKNDLFNSESFAQSVDHRGTVPGFMQTYEGNPWPVDHHLRKSFYFGRRPDSMTRDHDWMCVENGIEFIKSRPKDQPFFLYLPLIFPHPPYYVEEPYFSMYDRSRVPLPAKADYENLPRFVKRYHEAHGMQGVSEDEQREIIAAYYGMITRTDALLGRMMDALEQEGLMEDTAIVVVSDHGDYTCDYGLVEKWWTGLTDNLVRVPLYIKYPGMERTDVRSDCLVESIDLFPTIMELAGIKDYHSQFGKSLVSLIEGTTCTHREYAFAEGGHHPEDLHCCEAVLREDLIWGIYTPKTTMPVEDFSYMHNSVMIRSQKWKYIKHLTEGAELYDLENDPREEKNLSRDARFSEVIRNLEGRLLEWYMRTSDIVPKKKDPRDF